MLHLVNKYPFAFIPLFFVLVWCASVLLNSVLSGWDALAQQFRLTSTFPGTTWTLQSARMRWNVRYGSCLTVGADVTGLMLSMPFLFRPGHPPLLLPWTEVTVAERRKFWFVRRVKLLLGREEQIPFFINGRLADRIQEAAGSSWPIEPVS